MNNQSRMIDADKLLEWLKIREEEAYVNATQTFSPSFFKGKADAFNDVAEHLNSGRFDPIPLPTIKPGDKVRIIDTADNRYINQEAIVKEINPAPPGCTKLEGISRYWLLSSLEVIPNE